MTKKHKIIGYEGLDLNSNEAKVAKVLSNYLHADVKLLKAINHFRVKTPDFVVNGEFWELKTIFSNKVNKIKDRAFGAESQASNIVIDIRKSKIHHRRASQMIHQIISKKNHIERVLLITKEKDQKVLDFKK